MRRIGRAGHAQADELAAVTHRPRLGGAPRPAEALRPLRVTLLDRLARPRLAAGRIGIGVVEHAQLDRIDLQRVGHLVHRRLERVHPRVFAGSAHVGRAGKIELDDAVRHPHVRRGIHGARGTGESFDVVANGVGLADALMDHRHELAVRACAEGDALFGERTVAVGEIRLAARQGDLDRAADHACGHDRDEDVRPRRPFAPECPADERRHHANRFRRDAERLRQRLPRGEDVLRGVVNGQPVAVPRRHERMRLHLVVMLVGDSIDLIDLHRSAGQRSIRIPLRERGRGVPLPLFGIAPMLLHDDPRGSGPVGDTNQSGGMRGVLESVGDDGGHGLAEVVDRVVRERHVVMLRGIRVLLLASGVGKLRRVEMRDDVDDARRALRGRRVDRGDASRGDGAGNENGVGEIGKVVLRRITRLAGDLLPAVDAVMRFADARDHDAPPARSVSERTSVRRASSILNRFCS